jgi:kumamolisin
MRTAPCPALEQEPVKLDPKHYKLESETDRFRRIECTAIAAILLLAFASPVLAQDGSGRGRVIVPHSSIERPEDVGIHAHTNVQIFLPSEGLPLTGPPVSGLHFETPASLACVYKLVSPVTSGCNPNTVTANPIGGSKVIGIVDAFDDPTVVSDLAKFSSQFGLPAANITVVFASGTRPPQDPSGGWEFEESVDSQYAHAMALGAKIILVEAASNSFHDLMQAEDVASSLVAAAGGGEVSNSWGGSEFSGETGFDSHFTTPKVVYFASSGDAPGVQWPSASPNVVSAGGTTNNRNSLTGALLFQSAWDNGGGGTSMFEARPGYQNGIAGILGNFRGTPDLSADSNPNTGVYVYDSNPIGGVVGPWWIAGGTSVASPLLAGIVNSAGHFFSSTNAELTTIYGNLENTTAFFDIITGYCGPYGGYLAGDDYDYCTGVGTPIGKLVK